MEYLRSCFLLICWFPIGDDRQILAHGNQVNEEYAQSFVATHPDVFSMVKDDAFIMKPDELMRTHYNANDPGNL